MSLSSQIKNKSKTVQQNIFFSVFASSVQNRCPPFSVLTRHNGTKPFHFPKYNLTGCYLTAVRLLAPASAPSPLPAVCRSCSLSILVNMLRQWRTNAQRNIRNQWSKLSSLRHQWRSYSSSSRSHVLSLVNSYLYHSRYLDDMDLGVLSDMPNIRKKARCKWLKQQELHGNQLLSSYKSMAGVVVDMIKSSRSMRSFLKASTGSPLTELSSSAENSNDTGDGGGAPVFTFLPISAFEMLAEELLEMFKQELLLKRLLVVELLSVTCQKHEQYNKLSWADELYNGEADDLRTCNAYSKETTEPCLPKINGRTCESAYAKSDKHPSSDVLNVYLTAWLAEVKINKRTVWLSEVNIDTHRLEEIFATICEEIGTSFLKK